MSDPREPAEPLPPEDTDHALRRDPPDDQVPLHAAFEELSRQRIPDSDLFKRGYLPIHEGSDEMREETDDEFRARILAGDHRTPGLVHDEPLSSSSELQDAIDNPTELTDDVPLSDDEKRILEAFDRFDARLMEMKLRFASIENTYLARRLARLERALRRFPELEGVEHVDSTSIYSIAVEHERILMNWAPIPKEIEFIDPTGREAKLVWETADEGVGLKSGWLLETHALVDDAVWPALLKLLGLEDGNKITAATVEGVAAYWRTVEAQRDRRSSAIIALAYALDMNSGLVDVDDWMAALVADGGLVEALRSWPIFADGKAITPDAIREAGADAVLHEIPDVEDISVTLLDDPGPYFLDVRRTDKVRGKLVVSARLKEQYRIVQADELSSLRAARDGAVEEVVRQLHEARNDLARLQAMNRLNDWRPIATAPRMTPGPGDGPKFLGIDIDVPGSYDVYYHSWDDGDKPVFFNGDVVVYPTHWRPLPTAPSIDAAPKPDDPKHPHIVGGRFQSDKYPTCPAGKVPLSTKDPMAQDLLWEYANRRVRVDKEFTADLRKALEADGFRPLRSAEVLLGTDFDALTTAVAKALGTLDAIYQGHSSVIGFRQKGIAGEVAEELRAAMGTIRRKQREAAGLPPDGPIDLADHVDPEVAS